MALWGTVAASTMAASVPRRLSQPGAPVPPSARTTSVPGGPVSRREVLERAQFWVARGVRYLTADGRCPASAPDPNGRRYRTDCSGYVCMAWHVAGEPSTERFGDLGGPIHRDELLPGDALLWAGRGGYGPDGGHVLLFGRWANPERSAYLGYELSSGARARNHVLPFPYRAGDARYVPWRYRAVT